MRTQQKTIKELESEYNPQGEDEDYWEQEGIPVMLGEVLPNMSETT